jgi:hypothetical protein
MRAAAVGSRRFQALRAADLCTGETALVWVGRGKACAERPAAVANLSNECSYQQQPQPIALVPLA